MKILVTPTSFANKESIAACEKLAAFADEVVFNSLGRPLTSSEVSEMTSGCDGYLAGLDTIDAKAIEGMPSSLKVISRYGVGLNNVDLEAAKKRGIAVTNTPLANSQSVAELAVGLMFCAARRLPRQDASMRMKKWELYIGMELAGKRLGILGFGNIGRLVARIAQGIPMHVSCYDPYVTIDEAAAYGVIKEEATMILEKSDVLSLHLPLNDSTYHIIDEAAFSRMKRGCILINTSRGGLIDEVASMNALDNGKLRALALDVFEQEPPINSPLLSYENVIFSPHAGAHTAESVSRMANMAVDSIISILSNIVTKRV